MRILTLTPAATDIISALGFEDQLIKPEFSLEGAADFDAIQGLAPDMIVTTLGVDSDEAAAQAALAARFENPPQLINLVQSEIADVLANITRVSGLLGVPERGAAVMLRLESRLKDIHTRAMEFQPKPTVAAIEWVDPLMTCGNWIPELITMAGGVTLFGREGKPSFQIEWDELWAADPDRIILMACGYTMDQTLAAMPALTRQPGWATLRAIRDKQVYITNADHFFCRPSPRLAESLEILAEILHPEAFHFGHEGTGWMTYSS